MNKLPLQRRAERRFVRFQARLEAGVGDRWIPVVLGCLLIFILSIFSLKNLERYQVGSAVSQYGQSLWELSKGGYSEATLFGLDSPIFQIHWSVVLYPFSLLAFWVNPVKGLLFIQAVALGVAVFPLWFLARQVTKLRVSAATVLILAYALHPATHRLATQDFHLETLSVPIILSMAYTGSTKKWRLYWVCVVLLLALRADLGLLVAMWGFVLLSDGENRQGIRSLAVGFVWALGSALVVTPLLGQDIFRWDNSIFDETNVSLLVSLLAPVLFLPILSIRHILPAIPLAAVYFVATGPISFGDPSPFLLAYSMVAATYALHRLGHIGVSRVFTDGRLLAAFFASSFLLFIDGSPLSIYQSPWNWGNDDQVQLAVDEARGLISSDEVVKSSVSALPAFVGRSDLHVVIGDSAPVARVVAAPQEVSKLLVIERDFLEWSDVQKGVFDEQLRSSGFTLVYNKSGVYLYSRE